ncbi:MAG: TraB/GumN family protein [Deltaproteobacteria bacterium]|nr:TraB/GumN family protein [Deltaproteobacteria bacterium]MBW1817232.1 TraB/GumN family protein [Deltaproteobacteria bacterium]MBW2285005.1 TraB/GumN family protein [Deltaproteobacteria bacterium]
MTDNDNTHHLIFEGKDITLIGTAHVSRESAELVSDVIREQKPETVCVELCESRYQAITQKDQWENTNLIKVIREKKAFLLLANLMLASFQKKMALKLGVKPGEEMIRAIEAAKEIGAHVHLADRDIRTTLSRTWRLMGFWTKIKLLAQFVTSFGDVDNIKEEDIEEMKRKDVLETLLSEIGEALPDLRRILIDERDQYLASKIRTAPGKTIVAVVGAGHVPGIHKNWETPVDLDALDQIPPKGKLIRSLKWAIPAVVIALIVMGFFYAGAEAGADMVKWWVLANAGLAGLGAAAALAHPVTILTAVVASPITSLNPMIAAGWVAGLVETFIGKPKVKDFERLPEDIVSARGFWRNKITRILLVVVLTNVGSSLGAFVAIPLMMRAFG